MGSVLIIFPFASGSNITWHGIGIDDGKKDACNFMTVDVEKKE